MKITLFQSDKGDCLLLTGADGRHMLVDGGMAHAYTEHVSPTLGALRERGERLDLVYVSHIDEDHISGVLRLLDDAVDWRVHDFQLARGNVAHKPPRSTRPPEIDAIWHNAFHELVGDNAASIESMLAATAKVLSGAASAGLRAIAEQHAELATGERQAIRVSRRIGQRQLNIPLNPEFGGKLMFVRDGVPPLAVGGMALLVIGPFKADLERLREKWNDWLDANDEALREIAERARADEARLAARDGGNLLRPLLAQAEELGRRENVTAPNLASLMLLAREAGKTVLLTGDGHAADILKGLRRHGCLDAAGRIHVDVLKVQHHGSEHNLDAAFCQAVTADHYLFCGNGMHENPDLRVVKTIVASRLTDGDARPFRLTFNSHASVVANAKAKSHMAMLEQEVGQLRGASGGRLTFQFLKESKLELAV